MKNTSNVLLYSLPVPPHEDEIWEEALESIIEDWFDDLDSDSSKSFHYKDDKVVVDRDEMVEIVMFMCARTVKGQRQSKKFEVNKVIMETNIENSVEVVKQFTDESIAVDEENNNIYVGEVLSESQCSKINEALSTSDIKNPDSKVTIIYL